MSAPNTHRRLGLETHIAAAVLAATADLVLLIVLFGLFAQ